VYHTKILLGDFRGTKHNIDHYLSVTKVTERLSIRKCAAQKCDMERLNLKRLNDVEVTEHYQFKISNRFAVLENLNNDDDDDDDDDMGINRASGRIRT
jgi:hypothetical protein